MSPDTVLAVVLVVAGVLPTAFALLAWVTTHERHRPPLWILLQDVLGIQLLGYHGYRRAVHWWRARRRRA